MAYIDETNTLSNESRATTGQKFFGANLSGAYGNPNIKPWGSTTAKILVIGVVGLVAYFIYKKVK